MRLASPDADSGPRELYLDLLARSLMDALYDSAEAERAARDVLARPRGLLAAARAWLAVNLLRRDVRVTGRLASIDATTRGTGPTWPRRAHTMIGTAGLANVRYCVEDVLTRQVPGDLIETGVWRGGSCIFMRGILKAHGVGDRLIWVADSFAGLPPPRPGNCHDRGSVAHVYEDLRVSLSQVQENFRRYGLLDDQVRFLAGWFADTLPTAPIDKLAVMRLDGDMYDSTMDALRALYPRLSVGGYVIIDDYGALRECARAVEDYRSEMAITDELVPFDWSGSWWRRTR